VWGKPKKAVKGQEDEVAEPSAFDVLRNTRRQRRGLEVPCAKMTRGSKNTSRQWGSDPHCAPGLPDDTKYSGKKEALTTKKGRRMIDI